MGANMPKQYLKLRGQEIALYSMQTFAGMPVRASSLPAPRPCCDTPHVLSLALAAEPAWLSAHAASRRAPAQEVGEIVVVCDPSYRDVFEGCKLPRSVLVKFALPGERTSLKHRKLYLAASNRWWGSGLTALCASRGGSPRPSTHRQGAPGLRRERTEVHRGVRPARRRARLRPPARDR